MKAPMLTVLLGSLLFLLGSPGHAADALEPYRAFARSADAARLLTVARASMERYWNARSDEDATDIDWPGPPAGVYVTLVAASGTRACVGSPTPYRGGMTETVRALSRRVLHADPRCPPVRREELANLRIVIAFADAGEPIADPMGVDPGRDGFLVTSAGKSVAFLPGEARTVSWALREARRIHVLEGPADRAAYRRFSVVSIAEPSGTASRQEGPSASP